MAAAGVAKTSPICTEAVAREGGWRDLGAPPHELRPEFSLNMGQCFNWRRVEGPEAEWVGVLGRTVLAVRQTPDATHFRVLGGEEQSEQELAARLRDYFQLDVSLSALYERWASADPRMAAVAKHIPGVRVVRQDPAECLFSFICSSNNNIPRITLMLDRLRQAYGTPLGQEGQHAFPSIASLAAASEDDLRALGLGYRAKFIVETATKLQGLGGEAWLLGLRGKPRREVQEALVGLSGVGRKVADCVALFSLDQAGAIPVDVHVWRIACRDYDPALKASKSLTPTIYDRVGDMFRERFGECAGWAHSLLFAAELPAYRARLPPELQADMEAFKKEEKEEKAVKRETAKQRKQQQQQQQEQQERVQEGGGSSDEEEWVIHSDELDSEEEGSAGARAASSRSSIASGHSEAAAGPPETPEASRAVKRKKVD